jgi:hypothetical protein
MIYCAIQGYANGDTDKIFRATDTYGNICGQKGSLSQDYPYTYLYNPINSVSNRLCVQTCPTGSTIPTCYNATCSSFTWIIINSTGIMPTGFTGATGYLLYESQGLLGRICIPSTNVLQNALSAVVEKISTASNAGTFGNFISDLKYVKILFYSELGMAVSCFRLFYCSFIHLDVLTEMFGRLHRLDFHFRNAFQ